MIQDFQANLKEKQTNKLTRKPIISLFGEYLLFLSDKSYALCLSLGNQIPGLYLVPINSELTFDDEWEDDWDTTG